MRGALGGVRTTFPAMATIAEHYLGVILQLILDANQIIPGG